MISVTKIVPRYAETDQMGFVHHSVYAIWYEQARTELLNQAGIPYDEIEKAGVLSPLVELKCQYKRPAHYNQEVTVYTKIVEVKPAKCVLQYELFDKENVLLNIGETTLAWIDAKNGRLVSLKKVLPEVYEKMLSMVEE